MSQDKPSAVDAQKVIGDHNNVDVKASKEEQQAVAEYSRDQAGNAASMKVKVHSPFHEYYDGQAFSISAENATGPFDILPHHHNFISLLQASTIVIRTVEKGEQRIQISGGIMHVKADEVIVFLDV